MLKIWYHSYELVPQVSFGEFASRENRKGALFKISWSDGRTGYADLFPWPELGDRDIDTEIMAIKRGKISPIFEQTIYLAKKDAEARLLGQNLITTGARVKNHFFVGTPKDLDEKLLKEIKLAGYTTLMFIVGKDIEREADLLSKIIRQNTQFMVRLDFKSGLDFQKFERFMAFFSKPEKSKIEFVVDPFPYDYESWKESENFATLAIEQDLEKIRPVDFEDGRAPFEIIVIKPARVDLDRSLKVVDSLNVKFCVTSNLDHPVGMAHSVAVAARLRKIYPNKMVDCGCLSLRVYQPSEFSSQVLTQGPYISGTVGHGVGFTTVLESLDWKSIRD